MKRLLLVLPTLLPACAAVPAPTSQPAQEAAQGFQEAAQSPQAPEWLSPVFGTALRALGRLAPLDAPLRLDITELEGRWGDAWFDPDTGEYVIRLSRDIPGPEPDWALTVLAHEWAHCLLLSVGHLCEDDHGPLWGVAFARCYRIIMDS